MTLWDPTMLVDFHSGEQELVSKRLEAGMVSGVSISVSVPLHITWSRISVKDTFIKSKTSC